MKILKITQLFITPNFRILDLKVTYKIQSGCSVKAIFAFAQLWVTAIKQGLVSACYFWVGSDVPIEGNVLVCNMDINQQQFCDFFDFKVINNYSTRARWI